MTYRSLACALMTMTLACGGGSDGGTDAPRTGDGARGSDGGLGDASADACHTLATTRCTQLMTCSAADLTKRYGDLPTCEARELLTCEAALAAPDTGQTAQTLTACASALGAESCSDFLQKQPPSACETPAGGLGSGSACGFSAQCATGFCATGTEDVCASCAPQPVAGDSCATVGCGQDLVCVTSTQKCQVPGELGATCTRALPCGDGLTCVGMLGIGSGSGGGSGSGAGSGTCMADVATAGSACDPKHHTAADCNPDAGLTCDTATMLCVAQPLANAGDACGLIDGVRTACAAGAACSAVGSGSGSCVAPAGDGDACDTAAGPSCLTPARCVPTGSGTAGLCTLPGSQTCE